MRVSADLIDTSGMLTDNKEKAIAESIMLSGHQQQLSAWALVEELSPFSAKEPPAQVLKRQGGGGEEGLLLSFEVPSFL